MLCPPFVNQETSLMLNKAINEVDNLCKNTLTKQMYDNFVLAMEIAIDLNRYSPCKKEISQFDILISFLEGYVNFKIKDNKNNREGGMSIKDICIEQFEYPAHRLIGFASGFYFSRLSKGQKNLNNVLFSSIEAVELYIRDNEMKEKMMRDHQLNAIRNINENLSI